MTRRVLFTLFAGVALAAQSRQVAITIDDLPRGGDGGGRDLASVEQMTRKLLAPLREIPVTGFVIAGGARDLGDAGLQAILRIWREHGAELGSHTYSHPDLNRVPFEDYAADIVQAEPAIAEARGGTRPKYFRHPYLHAGKDAAVKRRLQEFLDQRGYVVAPVTIDNGDYMFAAVYGRALHRDPALAQRVMDAYMPYMESIFEFFEARSKEVVGREFPQILLLHANQLNADAMPALLDMMRRRGYQVVSLETALRDPAYRLPEEYAGPGGFSWVHRWSRTKGLPPKGEPEPPAWIVEEFGFRP